jgi:Glyoxalase-like domain
VQYLLNGFAVLNQLLPISSVLNLVTSEAQSHQRHHLDLYAGDREAEVERLLGLGAQKVDWRYPTDADYIVLADPDGNKFCVIQWE